MKILLTGISGYIGAALMPRLMRDGHELRGMSRRPEAVASAGAIKLVAGDAVSGRGLGQALDGVEVAYYLIHSMEPSSDGSFEARERLSAEKFAAAAKRAGVGRIVYLGGPVPTSGRISPHLASRLAVEEVMLGATPSSVAFRASIVIGAGSRSFRFLVRLVERMPVLPGPGWKGNRTSPVDERDAIELLARAASSDMVGGESLDIRGRDIVSYGELIERIRDAMLVSRPMLGLGRLTLTPIASRIAAAIAGERHELIGPLMESLEQDLLPRDDRAAQLLDVRLHSLDGAIEHALRAWEENEPLRAR
ncbi:MAG: NAD(P)H-binding protein [Solirubrobacteraceae bacterium]